MIILRYYNSDSISVEAIKFKFFCQIHVPLRNFQIQSRISYTTLVHTTIHNYITTQMSKLVGIKHSYKVTTKLAYKDNEIAEDQHPIVCKLSSDC